MGTYTVFLTRDYTKSIEVEVEASSEEEAVEKAAREDEENQAYSNEWHGAEVFHVSGPFIECGKCQKDFG